MAPKRRTEVSDERTGDVEGRTIDELALTILGQNLSYSVNDPNEIEASLDECSSIFKVKGNASE